MGSAIIGLIILIASFILNRMLNVKEAQKDITQPQGDIIEGDAWGRINTPTVTRTPLQRKNLDSGDGEDDLYEDDSESDGYKSVMEQWGSRTTSPDGYVPMFGGDSNDNNSDYERETPPSFQSYMTKEASPIKSFMRAETNPMTDSRESNLSQFSVANYQFGDSFLGRDIETEIAKTSVLKEAEELRIVKLNATATQKISIEVNLRDAIIYSAIFNPKYQEFEEFKEECVI